MKTLTKKILFYDKAILVLSFAIFLSIVLTVLSVIYAGSFEGQNKQLKTRLSAIQSLSGNVLQIKAVVESKETKIGLKKATGIVSALEQILKTHGLEAKIIKPLGKTKIDEFTEDNAALEIEGVDLNSLVNLLYKIDMSPVPLKIKSASMKATFEDPDKFVLKLTVSLMGKG